ncbi:MAG: hypothetical protein K8S99_13160 [Planctomycetes bacterium]|nr:hypothetical protein [Planctomycetota bacterium]
MSGDGVHVVKLGGSLLDLPDLLGRFEAWRWEEMGPRGVLVVGGGDAADVVRGFDKAFRLDQERAHWLAIRAMQLNTHCVAAVLPRSRLASSAMGCEIAWRAGDLAVIEPLAWMEREHTEGVTIPHCWSFTSDSIAAHLAVRLGSERLTLLKSTLPKGDCGPACAAGLGIVDEEFPAACEGVPSVVLVNLRSSPAGRCILR